MALLTLAILAASRLPVSLLPEVGIPRLTVQVSYPNAAARTVEETVVAPLRGALLQVNKLSDLRSRSREEAAVLYLDFPFGTNPDLAFIEVNEKIDQAMNQLPREVDRPRVLATDVSDIPVVQLSVTLGARPPNNATIPAGRSEATQLLELSDLARNVLRRRLEQLPEVAFADLSGQADPRIVVRPDRPALRALGLGVEDLATLLREANIELGGLLLADGHYQYNVRFTGDLRTVDDLRGLYLRVGQRTIRLSELATVTYEATPPRGGYFYNGRPGVVFTVRKRADARLFALQDKLTTLLTDLRGEYPRLQFDLANDQTAILRASIDNLSGGLLYGAGFAILVLFAFFREWRRPLLIALAVPIALLLAILGFYLAGLSINVISLAGLILGLGLMIDNSIIVLDNLSGENFGAAAGAVEVDKKSKKETGQPSNAGSPHALGEGPGERITQIAQATNEVIRPLISSALTTVAVFLPLVYLSGIAGALFQDQAIAVTLALTASLLVAYFLLPMLVLLLGGDNTQNQITLTPEIAATPPPKWRTWLTTFTPIVALLTLGYFLLALLPSQGFPTLSRTDYQVQVDWNESLPFPEHRTRVRALKNDLRTHFDADVATFVGERQFLLDEENQAVDASELQVYFTKPPADDFAADLLHSWRSTYPRASFSLRPVANLFDRIFLNDEAWVELRLRDAVGRQTPGWTSAQPLLQAFADSGLQARPPARTESVALRLNYPALTTSRVDAEALRRRLLTLFSENEVTRLRANDRDLPVLIAGRAQLNTARLNDATVTNRDGNEIPLRQLISTERQPDYRTLSADRAGEYLALAFPDGTDPARVRQIAEEFPAFSAQLSGRFLTDQSRLGELTSVLGISLLLLYLILAAQFESLLLPLVVLLVVPVSLVGSLVALWLTAGSLNLLSLIGMVVTGGIVVNDAIIKVDMIERGRAAGLGMTTAIKEASRRRLRAIVMTSLTTILALAPVLFASGLGAELQQPLAITVIGGLVVGTLGSLYLVPGLYRILVVN